MEKKYKLTYIIISNMADKGDITPKDNIIESFDTKKECKNMARIFAHYLAKTIKEEFVDEEPRIKVYPVKINTNDNQNRINYDIVVRIKNVTRVFANLHFTITE